jgi:isoleucyl-tRNA synthetase
MAISEVPGEDKSRLENRIEKSDSSKREEEILAFWEENNVFQKSLDKDAPNGEFTFYDGPPFASGLPHSGSLLSSVSKDLIPRYKTMRGFRVRRRWGWDTHGLPIESGVEKKLGLKNKKEIVAMGVETFNEEARSMVLEYVGDWKRYVERVGRWVDFDNSYSTMDPTYMESVWWGLAQIHDKGNLYEGLKVLMYCPHDETPLSKAEITMDAGAYRDITEEAVTIEFKVTDPEKFGLPENTFILAWTTTPWTLPGNVGLAVGNDIEYGVYEKDGVTVVAAVSRAETYELRDASKKIKGSDLVGATYEPLYEIPKAAAHVGKKWEVLAADFVTDTDGTGVVHTAVIYGEDDFALGIKEGLPMVQLLNPNATYNDDAPEFIRGQYIKKAESLIKDDLEARGLLFARAMNTHSYPHCYRCGTALIYNAVSSWFINIQEIKDKMLAENETIAWIPEHLKHGRFQHNLETAPDWTISRNRFWATPLPIWKDAKGTITMVDSLQQLKALTKKSGNTYMVMRHGLSEHNIQRIVTSDPDGSPLTEEGRTHVQKKSEQELVGSGITKIYTSPFLRTRETAVIVAKALGIPEESIIVDERLRELSFGTYEGKSLEDFFEYRKTNAYDEAFPEGESYQDAKNRFGEFMYELDASLSNEKVLIVTHGVGFAVLSAIAEGASKEKSKELIESMHVECAEIRELDFTPLPHNRKYELDYHLPYIDEVQLVSESGESLTRVPEVVDCWVESGSMPFAEYHYPFENKDAFEKRSPGDFVSEYIAQTRAWFYYMHAMSVGLFGHAAFKNVITTGNILAADGAKVSKSKKNYTDPYVLFDRFSADAFRFYLMSSVLMQAEDLYFRDDEVKEIQNRVVNMLRNVLSFYTLFKSEVSSEAPSSQSTHPLDRWILARLAQVIQNATDSFDRYDVPRATRPMRDFIDDLSTWYLRRSRDRVKGSDVADAAHALYTLRTVLKEFAKCIAPVMPFVAEELFQSVKDARDPESVHLADWPEAQKVSAADIELVSSMERVRAIASEGLMLRQKSGIKVRQPLASLSIPGEVAPELASIIAEELNVKEIIMHSTEEEMKLDTRITPELMREGDVREFMRALADARKEHGLAPKDKVLIEINEDARETLEGVTVPGVHAVSFVSEAEANSFAYSIQLSEGKAHFAITLFGNPVSNAA